MQGTLKGINISRAQALLYYLLIQLLTNVNLKLYIMTEKELCLCKLEEVCLKCEEYKIEFNHYAQEVHNAWLNEQIWADEQGA